MTPAPQTKTDLHRCEQGFIDFIRQQVPANGFGSLTAQVEVEYQDGRPIMFRFTKPVEVQTKFR